MSQCLSQILPNDAYEVYCKLSSREQEVAASRIRELLSLCPRECKEAILAIEEAERREGVAEDQLREQNDFLSEATGTSVDW